MKLRLGKETSPDWRWSAFALALFAGTLLLVFRGVLSAGLTEHVPVSSFGHERDSVTGELALPARDSIFHTDQRFVVWLTARNAHALLGGPFGFFDAETCQPADASLAFGEPGLSLGLVGIPAWLLTRDPVATFNLVFFSLTLIAAFAMYLLVREWTGVPLAGIVAGLLYAFSPIKMADTIHVNVYDNAWTVLALYFATRWLHARRWRDVLGLSLCIVLQVGGSFYTVMGAVLIGTPMLVWLVLHFGGDRLQGLRHIDKRQVALLVLALVAISLFIFPPYLALQGDDGVKSQLHQGFRRLTYILPDGDGFWGWVAIALACVAFLPRRRLALRTELGDPRIAVVIGMLLTMIFSLGSIGGEGNYMVGVDPDGFVPYLVVSRYVPGLDAVRAPGAILPGAHWLLCVLAGIGAASLLTRASERHRLALAVMLIVLAWVETLRPAALGLEPRVRYGTIRMSPAHEDVALYRELVNDGELGPLLEVPVVPKDMVRGSQGILMSAYHHRDTSACYNPTRVSEELFALGRRLPDARALGRAYELGFRDVVLHHARDNALIRHMRAQYAAAAAGSRADTAASPRLIERGGTENVTVYRIEP